MAVSEWTDQPASQMLDHDPVKVDWSTVAEELAVNPYQGLTAATVADRLERYGRNELRGKPPVPAWRHFLAQFNSPLIYLLLVAVVISFVAWLLQGEDARSALPVDALVIILIVLVNAVLGFVQENRASNAVAALAAMTQPHATVLRDGVQCQVLTAELVPGDVLLLAEGDEVGADARLVSATALHVLESSLTGESVPVAKHSDPIPDDVPLGDRANMVFKGTAITQGVGRAIVVRTGMATEMGGIATMLEETAETPSPLTKEIAGLARRLGLAVVIIAAVVMAVSLVMSAERSAAGVIQTLILAVSLAVAAVPEGLPAILTVVLSLGVQRLARQNAIVKNLPAVETLGSASVIASDKTGTLTRNEMTVLRVVTASGEVELGGVGYRPQGEVTAGGEPVEDELLSEVRLTLAGGSLANNATLDEIDGEWHIQGDPTEAAFLVAAHKVGARLLAESFERYGEVPFTSTRKQMSVVGVVPSQLAEPLGGEHLLFSKGAPDVLLPSCTTIWMAGHAQPLTPEARANILRRTDELAGQAYRTLAVAFRPLGGEPVVEPGEELEQDLTYLGQVAIIDPPRAEAAPAITEAHRAGIRVLMITGDHPAAAARIAADLGIAPAGTPAATGRHLDALTDDEWASEVERTSVYARVAPRHKLRIISALQARGQVVAMTGDGVNDAPALKAADIGVAMGINGTEVTKEAANMILADDNFATIVHAVHGGRVIFDNIRKFLRFLLSSNMGEVFTVFLGTVLAGVIGLHDEQTGLIAAPLLATQILWINLLTDSFPALAMGVDPEVDDVMARAPRRPTDRVIDRRMWATVLRVGLVMALIELFVLDFYEPGGLFNGTHTLAEARTAAFTCLVLTQLFNAFSSRSAEQSAFRDMFSNKWLWGAVVLAVALQVAVVEIPFLHVAFGTAPLTLAQWGFCIGISSVVLWIEELHKLRVRARAQR